MNNSCKMIISFNFKSIPNFFIKNYDFSTSQYSDIKSFLLCIINIYLIYYEFSSYIILSIFVFIHSRYSLTNIFHRHILLFIILRN